MDASATEHPDEGMIHAWLDDALSAPEAARLEAHVQSCAECRARVAEARGLIAGASRIVAALDDVPAGTRPGWAQAALADAGAAGVSGAGTGSSAPAAMPQKSLWRWLRVTPSRAAVAATLLVALGVTLTYERAADPELKSMASVLDPTRNDVPANTSAEGAAPMAAGSARDALLDSAVKRRLAESQGRPTVGPAPATMVPEAPPPSVAPPLPSGAGEQVALGRRKEEEMREAAPARADRARTAITRSAESVAGSGAVSRDEAYVAAPPREQVASGRATGVAGAAPVQPGLQADAATVLGKSADAGARSCVRLESQDADARWGDQPFPLVLAFDAVDAQGRRRASVLRPNGSTTELRATWTPRGGDSVTIDLRRIGWSGSIALGPEAGVRSGYAVSGPAETALEAVTVTAAPQAQTRDRAAAGNERKAAASAAAAPRPAPAPAGPPLRQLRVTARAVACPN